MRQQAENPAPEASLKIHHPIFLLCLPTLVATLIVIVVVVWCALDLELSDRFGGRLVDGLAVFFLFAPLLTFVALAKTIAATVNASGRLMHRVAAWLVSLFTGTLNVVFLYLLYEMMR